jgi:hypothetical protein
MKKYLQKLTRRTVGVSSSDTGSQASVVVTQPALAQNLSQSMASSFEPHYHELVSEVETKINEELPALATKLGKNQEGALRYLATDQYCGLSLERAPRYLFGSQIDAIIFLMLIVIGQQWTKVEAYTIQSRSAESVKRRRTGTLRDSALSL